MEKMQRKRKKREDAKKGKRLMIMKAIDRSKEIDPLLTTVIPSF